MSAELAKTDANTNTGLGVPKAEGDKKYTRLATVLFFGSAAKGETKEAADAAGVEVDSFYLKDELGVRDIKPFRIVPTLLYWDGFVKRDQKNKPVATALFEQKDRKFVQYRTAFVFVVDEQDNVTPALISTSSALNRIWDVIDKGYQTAKAGEPWFCRGAAHRETAKTKEPCFRFAATIWGKLTQPKGDGDPYNVGYSSVSPSSAKLIANLEAFTDEDRKAHTAAFEYKVGELEKLLIA